MKGLAAMDRQGDSHGSAGSETDPFEGLSGKALELSKVVHSARLGMTIRMLELLREIDAEDRAQWRSMMGMLRWIGVRDDEVVAELGIAISTLHRWRTGDLAPRMGMRRVIKAAILDLMERRVSQIRRGAPGRR